MNVTIWPKNMAPDLSGAEVLEDVLKQQTGEEWTISTFNMVVGTDKIMDTPGAVNQFIFNYDGGFCDKDKSVQLTFEIPDGIVKSSKPMISPKITAEGKPWRLAYKFHYS